MRRFALIRTIKASTGLSHVALPTKVHADSRYFFGIFLSTSIVPAVAFDPTDDWRVADGVANIRIAQCNGRMWDAVVWEKQPGGRDTSNPDASKRSRPTLGMVILLEMKKKPGIDRWDGQGYDAKDGQIYSSSISPTDSKHLKIRGCVLGFLCGGETWTRVGPTIPSSPVNSLARSGAPADAAAAPTCCSRRPEARRRPAERPGWRYLPTP